MISKVSDFIAKHQLLSRNGLHIVALSGGADSVALLLILQQLGYRVEAAHCNFRLRGDESDRDEAFARNLCQQKQIPFHVIHFDTNEYASLHQVSIEMAARELRYRYFDQLCQDIGAETVCVAHHRDDAVETFLMNLLRGSGIHGLTGIRPKNGRIVRPLLCLSRQEIEDFLHSIGQTYVTDSTNLVDDVLRNKLRLRVIPLLKELNPSAVDNIDKTAGFLQESEQIINKVVSDWLIRLVHHGADDEQSVLISEVLQLPSSEQFLHEWLSPLGFNASQMSQLMTCLRGESGKEFSSATHTLVVDRGSLIVEPVRPAMKTIKIPETGRYRYDDRLLFSFEMTEDVTVSKSSDSITLDASRIAFPLTVRPVQQGDMFCPFGMEGRKLVSDFLTDRKCSLLEKRRQLVVTNANGDILWLVGHRTDHRYRITEGTITVLRIQSVITSKS